VAPLESGLRVIAERHGTAPLVSIGTTVRVGAGNDPPGKEGLAHLVEHLTYLSRPGKQRAYREHLRSLGATFNGATTHDLTTFWTVGSKEALPMMLQLEAWRLARTLVGVSAADLRREKQVVLHEIRQATVSVRPVERVLEAMFPGGHPLSRPIAGTAASLGRIRLSDAEAFVRRHYTPNAATIVIAGDVEFDEIKKMLGMWPAELLFGPRGPGGPRVEPLAVIERQLPPGDWAAAPSRAPVTLRGPFASGELSLAWPLPPGFTAQDGLMALAAARLQHVLGSPVSARFLPMLRLSVLVLSVPIAERDDPEAVRDRLLERLEQVWPAPLGRLDMERLRWATVTAYLRQVADPAAYTPFKAWVASAAGPMTGVKEFVTAFAGINDDDVVAFGRKWLSRDRLATVRTSPEDRRVGFTAETVSLHGADGTARDSKAEGAAFDADDLSDARLTNAIRSPRLQGVPTFQLRNGLRVYTVSGAGAGLFTEIRLRFPGGELAGRPAGSAGWALRLGHSTCAPDDRFHAVGGVWRHVMDANWAEVSATVLSGNLETGIAGLADQVRCLAIAAGSFERLPALLEARGAALAPEMQQLFAAGKLWRELYRGHPFAEMAAPGQAARLEHPRRDEMESLLHSLHRPERAVLIVQGDASADEVRPPAEQYLSSWAPAAGPPPPVPAAPPGPVGRKVILVDRPDWDQASVTVGCRLRDVSPRDHALLGLLESLLASRVLALRERWAASYGVHASVMSPFGAAAHATITGYIEQAKVATSVRRLLDVLAELGNGRLPPRDFLEARWDSGRRFQLRFAHPARRASAIAEAAMRGWPLAAWDDYPQALAATRPADLGPLLAPCAGKEIVTVVGPAARLRPQLDGIRR
jgi:zinc protease